MPNPRSVKRQVRARMAETGEKYTTALRALEAEEAAKEEDAIDHTAMPVWIFTGCIRCDTGMTYYEHDHRVPANPGTEYLED